MFYEEAIIDGVLCSRTTPDGEWVPFSPQALTERLMRAKGIIEMIEDAMPARGVIV